QAQSRPNQSGWSFRKSPPSRGRSTRHSPRQQNLTESLANLYRIIAECRDLPPNYPKRVIFDAIRLSRGLVTTRSFQFTHKGRASLADGAQGSAAPGGIWAQRKTLRGLEQGYPDSSD